MPTESMTARRSIRPEECCNVPTTPRQTEMTAEEFKAAAREQWSEDEFQRHVIDLARSLGWRVDIY